MYDLTTGEKKNPPRILSIRFEDVYAENDASNGARCAHVSTAVGTVGSYSSLLTVTCAARMTLSAIS